MLRMNPVGPGAGSSAATPPSRPASPTPNTPFRLEQPSADSPGPVAEQTKASPVSPPKFIQDLETRRLQIDRLISRATHGEPLSAGELLIWQARIYAYSQQIDVISKVVDRAVSAVKTTLNTQI